MKRDALEKHLATAKSNLEARANALKAGGVAEDAYSCDPVWRNLDASRRKVATRLHAVGKLEKREADAAARKEGGSEE
ncbi:hypothetical protein AYO47_04465 [Planctomyces sp. SCGC AG-212-M04]|nr:hypothetical protein AYO47_04465 [Planctomyces sp. SCGC AG-212-M04]